MIKKLKNKLIFISLLSVGIVLTIIISTSYVASIINITLSTDNLIDNLHMNNGEFNINSNDKYDKDTYSQTRYFIVDYSNDGVTPPKINSQKIHISEDLIIYLSNKALNKRIFDKGYISSYRYNRFETSTGTKIIFIDCHRQMGNVHFLISSAILISLISLVTIFSILRLFANKILKPIIEAHEKQKKFITNASHELKTPLTVITANSELLEMEYGENEYTQTINKQIHKLTSMTNALVMLSKIDEMNTLNDMNEFSISDAAYDTVSEFVRVINKEFNFQIDEDVTYFGNEKLIRDLIRLILDNARKYSKTFVNFTVTKNKNKITITCINDADGLEKGNLIRFSERFYRTDESRVSVFDGSGIGLSLAKDIVEIHKGNLKIYSPDGQIYIISIIL